MRKSKGLKPTPGRSIQHWSVRGVPIAMVLGVSAILLCLAVVSVVALLSLSQLACVRCRGEAYSNSLFYALAFLRWRGPPHRYAQ